LRVDELALEDWRNFARAQVELSPHLNLVIGRNAQGKTNLLEALYCLGGLGSPRGLDVALVREGAARAVLHAVVVRRTRRVRVDLEVRPGRGSRALLNRAPVDGVRRLAEVVSAVFFGPDELSLIKGSPERRRRFLDDLVVKIRPARDGLRREWERVLRQRNALLKSMPRSGGRSASAGETLAVWDAAFCRAGATVAAARLEALRDLLPHARRRYEHVAGTGRLEMIYASSWLAREETETLEVSEARLRTSLEKALAAEAARELERGMSLVGPQRDDVVVSLAPGEGPALDARTYASQGDQRTAALALKLAESDLLAECHGERPILLLDDVFSELDPARRGWLSDAVRGLGQVVLSSAEPGAVESAGADLVLGVDGGRVARRG
jgi:DNA replication and repair protein RecF